MSELAEAIGQRLRDAFPAELWVRGEIQDLNRARSGHVYFSLRDGGDDAGPGLDTRLSVMLRARDKDRVNRLLHKAGGRVRMTDGTEVRIRGRVDFFAPRGQLQLRMVSIDPAFTLGQLAAARAALVDRLRTDGLLDRNRTVPMPLVPLRVGLVTSTGSAADADVRTELDRSGYAFEVVAADVRVQGADAPGSIAGAIRWFAGRGAGRDRVDVVVVARGGGSATDLAAFDEEVVARAIAESPFPVVTGVGHEVDRTVADEVAHTVAKTPTAAAQVLVARVAAAHTRAESAFGDVLAAAARCVRQAQRHLDRLAGRAATAAGAATRAERTRVDELERRLASAATRRLDRGEHELATGRRRLRRGAQRVVDEADRVVTLHATRTAALDPARTLARGWSITRTADGAVVRSARGVPPGTSLRTTVADGTIHSVVDEATEPDPEQTT